jgi:hypothetical protein
MISFKEFIHKLQDLNLGDLVTLFEREEELEALVQEEGTDLEQAALLGEVGEHLKVIIKEGINDTAEESLEEIKR